MRKTSILSLVLAALCLLTACSSNSSAIEPEEDREGPLGWKDYYDLGVRYLSEGNYQEAIIAFTSAIEIDPMQALAYVGRGDAYKNSGETEANLVAAQADYEKALALDETNAEVYLALADVYILLGDYDNAIAILHVGIEKAGSSDLLNARLSEIEKANLSNYSQYITDDLISESEFVIGGVPFYELPIESAVAMLPNSDLNMGMEERTDSDGNLTMRAYTVFKDNVGGIICCEQKASSDTLYRLSFRDYYHETISEVATGIRSIKTGDTIETVLQEIGISDNGAVTLSQTGLSIVIGANSAIGSGHGWIETEERTGSYSGTPTRMLNIYMDTCSCQMDFIDGRLVGLQVWVSNPT